jgi:hypothetical protein
VRVISLLLYCCLLSFAALAQETDSLRQVDTTKARIIIPDSTPVKRVFRRPVPKPPVIAPAPVLVDSMPLQPAKPLHIETFRKAIASHPYFNFSGKPLHITSEAKKREGNEPMFYALIGLLLFFSMIRLGFDKYLHNMLTLFFRVTMRQQQLRDQLLGAPLPSLLLNFLFVINTGVYLAFIAESNGFLEGMNFWIKSLYGMLLVTAIYVVKYIVLKIMGWIFNVTNATDTYTFVVFLVNKMIGIFLLPLIVVMSFASPAFLSVLVVLSYFMIGAFFVYRFLIAFRPIRNEIKVNRFHFFLYLCAFEIAPLMLIYKVLLNFVEKS